MRVIESWDIQSSFWKQNPQFTTIEPYQTLYKEDKSKTKDDSSKHMWAYSLLCDTESKYRQVGYAQRKELIARDYLKDKKFDWTQHQKFIDGWELFKTPMEKQLEQWKRFIHEKNELMSTMKLTEDNWETIEKMVLSNGKLQDEYDKITKRINQEEDSGIVMGGAVESLIESGVI